MKQIVATTILIVFCVISTGLTCELTVRTSENPYPPFFTKDGNGEHAGLSVELVETLLNEAECKPVYKPLPFKRAL